MSELLVNTIKKADGTGNLTVPAETGTLVIKDGSNDVTLNDITAGGIYLGGTGAANYLDDYEEGTWTPTVSNGGFSGFSRGGHYTKVGRQVTVILEADLQGTANSGTFVITGLPFSEGVNRYSAGSMYARYYNSEGTELVTASVAANTSEIKFVEWGTEAIGTDFSAGYFAINITYFTS